MNGPSAQWIPEDSAKPGHGQTPDATSIVTMIYPHGHGLLGLLPYLILIETNSKFDKVDGLFMFVLS